MATQAMREAPQAFDYSTTDMQYVKVGSNAWWDTHGIDLVDNKFIADLISSDRGLGIAVVEAGTFTLEGFTKGTWA